MLLLSHSSTCTSNGLACVSGCFEVALKLTFSFTEDNVVLSWKVAVLLCLGCWVTIVAPATQICSNLCTL